MEIIIDVGRLGGCRLTLTFAGTECVSIRRPCSKSKDASRQKSLQGSVPHGSCSSINNSMVEYVFFLNSFSLFLLCRPIPNVEVVVANGHVPKRPSLLLKALKRHASGLSVSVVTKQANREISNSTHTIIIVIALRNSRLCNTYAISNFISISTTPYRKALLDSRSPRNVIQ